MPRSKDARADFSKTTKDKIRAKYNGRCGICLQKPPNQGRQCAHLFDASRTGAKQVEVAIYMGVISPGYQRSSAENGMVQCPTCHLAFFDSEHVALSPTPQVLKYVVEYLRVTDAAEQKPLYEVFRLLNDALEGIDVDLPNMTSILPFLGLFTLVVLLPDELNGSEIPAHHLPDLFVLDGSQFIPAPANMLPDAPGVARIFDVSVISDELPKAYYTIPLSPKHAGFTQQRYWRVPAKPEVILMMLMERIRGVTESGCEEIKYARVIYCTLHLQKIGEHEVNFPNGKKRMSEDDNDERPHKVSRRGELPTTKGRSGLRIRIPALSVASSRGPGPPKTLRLKI